MRVDTRRSSSGSAETSTTPSTFTNAYGGVSVSTTSETRGSRAMARALPLRVPVAKSRSPSSTMNQTGATWGRPSEATHASLPVRESSLRKSRASEVLIGRISIPFVQQIVWGSGRVRGARQ